MDASPSPAASPLTASSGASSAGTSSAGAASAGAVSPFASVGASLSSVARAAARSALRCLRDFWGFALGAGALVGRGASSAGGIPRPAFRRSIRPAGWSAEGADLRWRAAFCRCLRAWAFFRAMRARSRAARLAGDMVLRLSPFASFFASPLRSVRERGALLARAFCPPPDSERRVRVEPSAFAPPPDACVAPDLRRGASPWRAVPSRRVSPDLRAVPSRRGSLSWRGALSRRAWLVRG